MTVKVENHAYVFSPHYKGEAVFEAGVTEHAHVPDQNEHQLLGPSDEELFPFEPVERWSVCLAEDPSLVPSTHVR